MSEDLVAFFKALADANRLKIVGLLAQRGCSVEELAALLHLKAPTVSHHLARLAQVGLVTARAEGYYSIYQLDRVALETAARDLFSSEKMASVLDGVDLQAYPRKVLSDFCLPDGHIKAIPAQRKKLEVVLQYVIKAFQSGMKYPEKQVNAILARFHPDTASLRRELVGYGLLKRSVGGKEYWVEKTSL